MRDFERRLLAYRNQHENSETPDSLHTSLVDLAYERSRGTAVSLRSIIDDLVSYAYDNHRLLDSEFNEAFTSLDLAELIVKNFISSLGTSSSAAGDTIPPADREPVSTREPQSTREPLSQREPVSTREPLSQREPQSTKDPATLEFLAAKNEALEYIKGYGEDNVNRTLSFFIKYAKKAYPEVDFQKVFNEPDVLNALIDVTSSTAQKIVAKRIENIFNGFELGKQERESDKESQLEACRVDFILDFVFSRILKYTREGGYDFDNESAERLLLFLEEMKFDSEKLYMVLFSEFRKISQAARSTRKNVSRILSVALDNLDQYPFLNPDFDFDRFFHGRFTPIIRALADKRLPRGKVRLVDVKSIVPVGMSTMIYPSRANSPIDEKLKRLLQHPEEYEGLIREFFNYADPPEADLSLEEIEAILAEQLDKAKKQIEYTVRNGLKLRSSNDPIHSDCQFIPEIINCRSLQELLQFLGNANSFKKKYPEYEKISGKVICHQARKMIELMLFYRKHAFEPEFKRASQNRELIEDHLKRRLHIENLKSHEMKFRIKMQIDEEGNPVMTPDGKGNFTPNYDVAFDPVSLKLDPDKVVFSEEGERRYKVFPVESKAFIEAECQIPNGRIGASHAASLLIYSGDGNLIHKKSTQSYLSSLLRGKQPSDVLRWAIITYSQDDNDHLRDFLYENYSTSQVLSLTDSFENRTIEPNKKKQRTGGSKLLASRRGYTSATYATLPRRVVSPQGVPEVDHQHIAFETQIYDLKSMLIFNLSDYTMSSHSHSYTPEREFENLFKYFFPPIIYGKRFAAHKMRGYNPENNL